MLTAAELSEQYPDRKIYAVDTLCVSMGLGLLIWQAGKMRRNGASIEEVRDWVEENKLRFCHWFSVDDLMFLKRGGRLSAASALLGTMLSIKPILHVDNERHLIPVGKVRGRSAVLRALLDHMKETADNPAEQTIFISHGDCEEDARRLYEMIQEEICVKDVLIGPICPTIGGHTGPGTIALFFLGRPRCSISNQIHKTLRRRTISPAQCFFVFPHSAYSGGSSRYIASAPFAGPGSTDSTSARRRRCPKLSSSTSPGFTW
jgi:DegV family protein with EDD domain